MVDSDIQVKGIHSASESIKRLAGGKLFKNEKDNEKFQKIVEGMALGAGAVTLYATDGDFRAAGVATSVMYTSANITESLASAGLKKIEKRFKYSYDYNNMYDDLVLTANEDEAYNNSVSFAVGRVSEGQPDHSLAVKLNGGYMTGVSMTMKDGEQYSGYQPTDGYTPKRPFNVQDLSEFRKTNAHLSSVAEERKALHNEDVADQKDQIFTAVYGNQFKRLLDPLKKENQREDTYLDVTGAPYRYYQDSEKLYPTTVRYSGESLEQLVKIADLSAKRRNAGKGKDYTIDMVDLTYAHGFHAQDVRERRTKLTRPEYTVDEGSPDMQTDVNWRHNMVHLVKTGLHGVKTFAKNIKDKGSEYLRRRLPKFKVVEQQVEESLDALRVIEPQSSASVAGARPLEQSEKDPLPESSADDELRRVMELNQRHVRQSVQKQGSESRSPDQELDR